MVIVPKTFLTGPISNSSAAGSKESGNSKRKRSQARRPKAKLKADAVQLPVVDFDPSANSLASRSWTAKEGPLSPPGTPKAGRHKASLATSSPNAQKEEESSSKPLSAAPSWLPTTAKFLLPSPPKTIKRKDKPCERMAIEHEPFASGTYGQAQHYVQDDANPDGRVLGARMPVAVLKVPRYGYDGRSDTYNRCEASEDGIREAFQRELDAYHRLQALQGVVIPQLIRVLPAE